MPGWLRRRWLLLTLIGVPVVLVALLAVDVAARYLPAVRALQDGKTAATQAETLLRSDPAKLDAAELDRARGLLAEAQADFGPRSAIVGSGWLADLVGHLPVAGDQVTVARALRQVGIAGTSVGLDAVPLVSDMLPQSGSTTPALTRVVSAAAHDQADIDRLGSDIATLSAAMKRMPAGRVRGPLGSAQATVERDVPRLLTEVAPLTSVLDGMFDATASGRHTYLMLLGNPGEERPGGGFIGAIGQVVVDNGKVVSTTFRVSDFSNSIVTSIPAPGPLNRYLFNGHPWELSDANWSPDFPTSAQEVEHFYELATGVQVDGVISVDPVALSEVLQVLGPIRVAPYPQVITAANALTEINYIINKARPTDPGKTYLAPLGQTVLDTVLHAPVQTYPRLAGALAEGIGEEHVVMYFNSPSLQSIVDRYDAGGRVTTPAQGDSLLVNDANISGSKADLFVKRNYDLKVGIDPNGTVHDDLTLTYDDVVPSSAADRALVKGSGGAYRDYVRVLLPPDAAMDGMLLTAGGVTRQVSAETVAMDSGRLSVAYYLVVPPGQTESLELLYHGPLTIRHGGVLDYSLAWSKQVQALTWPIQVTVTEPDGAMHTWSSNLDTSREFRTAS